MTINVGTGGDESQPEVMIEINTTPLIDVMLVLLIMLIITIPIQTHAVKLSMPVAKPPPIDKPPMVVRVDIEADGTILSSGTILKDAAQLDVFMRDIATSPDQPEVHLRPSKLVAYRYVAMVMASAQRSGVTKIGVLASVTLR